ncbi:MAG: universal stress protein [Mycobacteriales bacterium]
MNTTDSDLRSESEPVIVVGYDENHQGAADVTLAQAADLTARLGGRLHVVQAIPAPRRETALPTGVLAVPELAVDLEAEQDRRDQGERELAEHLRARMASGDLSWTCEVDVGDPADVLADCAERVQAYLVVIGTRSRGVGAAFDRLLTGSTVRNLERRLGDERPGLPMWSLVVVPHP